MKLLKNILYKLLGKTNYYLFVSKAFFILYGSGLLRISKKFDYHYFVKDLIEPGYQVIDIGANMGYYTKIFAQKCGSTGFVHAIEPVALFRKVLEKNVRKLDNIKIYPFALGKEDGKTIKMGIPAGAEKYRHGLTRVLDNHNSRLEDNLFEAIMYTPDHLFGNIKKCNYIKCDVGAMRSISFLFSKTSLRNIGPYYRWKRIAKAGRSLSRSWKKWVIGLITWQVVGLLFSDRMVSQQGSCCFYQGKTK